MGAFLRREDGNQENRRKAIVRHDGDEVVHGRDQRAGGHGRVYQDAIFDTKKKALPGVQVPKRAKNKDFQQILGLLESFFVM